MDNGDPVDIVYLDFQKAFDKMPHKRLIHKVRSLGIRGSLLVWIGNWLMDRRQRVGINGFFPSMGRSNYWDATGFDPWAPDYLQSRLTTWIQG